MRQLDLLTVQPPRTPSSAPPRPIEPWPMPRESAREELAAWLRRTLGTAVQLRVTDNHRIMVSARRTELGRVVRVHHMFLDAPEAVREALARYLAQGDAQSCAEVDAYIAARRDAIRPRVSPTAVIAGAVHPLPPLHAALTEALVPEAREVSVTYGRGGLSQPASTRRRSLHLGTYLRDATLARLHPVLDAAWVPEFFVAFVLHHELLHHAVPPRMVDGRRRVHPPEFVAREQRFPQYEEALRWERANLPRLIRARDGLEDQA